MILLSDYFGPWIDHDDATDERKAHAAELLEKVNALLDEAFLYEIEIVDNPTTGTLISGSTYGGFRPQDCKQGAPTSSHKIGRGVDIYDPHNALDNWITDAILEKHGLYREAPLATNHWCHLSDRAPGSGNRTFMP
jgi:hypothetical protein